MRNLHQMPQIPTYLKLSCQLFDPKPQTRAKQTFFTKEF